MKAGRKITPEPDAKDRYAADLTRLISYRVSVLGRQLARTGGRDYLAKLGLSLPQWRVISTLGAFGERTVTEISDGIFMDRGQTSRTVDGLARSGLVCLRADVKDARRTLYSLSVDGEKLYRRGLPIAADRQKRLVESLDADEVAAFSTVLDKLIALTASASRKDT
jgi:DNA-binding MarR family transcriptional regulator